jgi:hypothetical protein
MPNTPFNIKDILKISQKQINESTASSHSQDLIYLLKIAIRGDGNPIHMYDSAGALPNLLDDVTDPEQIAYVKDEKNLFFSDKRYWKPLLKHVATPAFQGTKYGFAMGGGPIANDVVEKYSFSSDNNGVNVGSLSTAANHLAGHSDTTNEDGYVSGGAGTDAIQKFSFTSSNNATTAGSLTEPKGRVSGASDVINAAGYTMGGQNAVNRVEKFNFASSTSGAAWGGLTSGCEFGAGSSDTTGSKGYVNYGTRLEQFSFASNANATTVGGLPSPVTQAAGNSSLTHGYVSGGLSPLGSDNVYKYAFSNSPVEISDIGNLSINRLLSSGTGASSKQHGYVAGGNTSPSGGLTASTEKYSFQSGLTGISVANLTASKHGSAGAQH